MVLDLQPIVDTRDCYDFRVSCSLGVNRLLLFLVFLSYLLPPTLKVFFFIPPVINVFI